jgi:hypothetical protein
MLLTISKDIFSSGLFPLIKLIKINIVNLVIFRNDFKFAWKYLALDLESYPESGAIV